MVNGVPSLPEVERRLAQQWQAFEPYFAELDRRLQEQESQFLPQQIQLLQQQGAANDHALKALQRTIDSQAVLAEQNLAKQAQTFEQRLACIPADTGTSQERDRMDGRQSVDQVRPCSPNSGLTRPTRPNSGYRSIAAQAGTGESSSTADQAVQQAQFGAEVSAQCANLQRDLAQLRAQVEGHDSKANDVTDVSELRQVVMQMRMDMIDRDESQIAVEAELRTMIEHTGSAPVADGADGSSQIAQLQQRFTETEANLADLSARSVQQAAPGLLAKALEELQCRVIACEGPQERLLASVTSVRAHCDALEDHKKQTDGTLMAIKEELSRTAHAIVNRSSDTREHLGNQVRTLNERSDSIEAQMTALRAECQAATSNAIVGVGATFETRLADFRLQCDRLAKATIAETASALRQEMNSGLANTQAMVNNTMRGEKERAALSWHYMGVAAQALGRQPPESAQVVSPGPRSATPLTPTTAPLDAARGAPGGFAGRPPAVDHRGFAGRPPEDKGK